MTQTDRVLAAARSYRGCCALDFQLPNVVDGGAPILRVAARIHDLEEQGYTFERLPPFHHCAVYRLLSSPDVERAGSASAARREGPASSAEPRTGSLNAESPPKRPTAPAPPRVRRAPARPAGPAHTETEPVAQILLFEAPPERPSHYKDAA